MANDQNNNDLSTTVGLLADGFANTAIDDTSVEDDSTAYVGGLANGDNRNNTTTNTSTDVDVDADVDVAMGNGSNRENDYDYDWDYDNETNTETEVTTVTETETDITTISDSNNRSEYDWNYDSEYYSNTETETDTEINTITETDTDIETDITTVTETETEIETTTGSFNSADADNDFGTLRDLEDFGNLGVAGGDLAFDIGDDFSFTLDVNNILNDALDGAGNDSAFSAVQANHLADQDSAYGIRMENGGATNTLAANAGDATGDEGLTLDGRNWDLDANDDVSGVSTADASAILANSGFHFEFVQGANLLTNSVDSSVVGHDSAMSSVGEDTDG